jgi:hypothetical protein
LRVSKVPFKEWKSVAFEKECNDYGHSIMAAIAELRIAQQFISTLFMGFVFTLALALGLAFGLGSKNAVSEMMDEWYKNTKKDLK